MTLYDYLNSEMVRTALHVPAYVWPYSDPVAGFKYYPNFEASSWIYDVFYKYGYKMIHIEGDTDGILPLHGIWKWLKATKWPMSKPWSPWLTNDAEKDLIGFIKEYGNGKFTLATIHG